MAALIWLTGLLAAVFGVSIVLHPDILKTLLRTFRKPGFLYLAGTIRAGLGVIFLVWAHRCNQPAVIIVIGILMIGGGAFIFLAPRTRVYRIIDFFLQQPFWLRRVWGLAAIAIGILVIWAGWLK